MLDSNLNALSAFDSVATFEPLEKEQAVRKQSVRNYVDEINQRSVIDW
jgi:hypothetical protein